MRRYGYVTNKLYSKRAKSEEINECCFLIPDEKANDILYLWQLSKEAIHRCQECEYMQCIQVKKNEQE